MATEYGNELTFAGAREDLASIREYVSRVAKADEDKPRYDFTVTETDGVIQMVNEPPIPLVSDVRFTTRGARLEILVNSRHQPCIELTAAISREFPAVAVGHTFLGEWGGLHGYHGLVAGETKAFDWDHGVESPEDDETGELANEPAAKFLATYRQVVDSLLTDFETLAVLAATVETHAATRAAVTNHAKADREVSDGGGHTY